MTTKSVRPPLTRAEGEAMRHAYLTSPKTVAEIQAEYQVSQFIFYMWLDGGPRVNGERMLPPVARRSPTRRKRTKREKLVERLWQAAGAHMRTLENRLKNASEPDERDTRMMAVLVKTLHDLHGFDGDKTNQKRKRGAEPAPDMKNDDARKDEPAQDDPRDIDEFRRELARRIAALDGGPDNKITGGV